MRNSPFWWILFGIIVLVDIYFFQAVKALSSSASGRTKTFIYAGYWGLSIAAILLLLILPNIHIDRSAKIARNIIFAVIAGLFLAKLVASFFFLIDDIRRGLQWLAGRLFVTKKTGEHLQAGERITRSAFLTWAGMLAGGGLFGALIHGFGNKYRYQVRRVNLSYDNLPPAFKGIKIIQISDIHSGSFTNKQAVMKGVQKIINEKPDLILFTGDLVNDRAVEMEDYMDVFNKLYAPLGIYSIFGNHDYGDYVHWDSPEEKKANLEKLKQVHANLGWHLLLNEHVVLEKNNDKIALIGVENWSAKAQFRKYGDLKKAYAGSESLPFKILMSHDPSHWKAEVCKSYPDIDLMLAGHTHGMQFGVELPGIKWSPVQYFYKEWAGLYENDQLESKKAGSQKLYVNRGYGFLGYPGRVGILPEITVFGFS